MNLTQTVFNTTASSYDRDRMKLIPCYAQFYPAAVSLVPPETRCIVDLGAGTGLFSAYVRAAFPEAALHLVDFSEPMLEQAKSRMGEDERIRYVLEDYSSYALPEECGAVVSALSIHHLEDERKQALFAHIYAALPLGGVFVNADHIAGPMAELEEVYQERWLAAIRAEGATEQQIKDSLYRQQEDRRSPVEQQLAWLRGAGFVDVDCWFKNGSFAVMTGRKG